MINGIIYLHGAGRWRGIPGDLLESLYISCARRGRVVEARTRLDPSQSSQSSGLALVILHSGLMRELSEPPMQQSHRDRRLAIVDLVVGSERLY